MGRLRLILSLVRRVEYILSTGDAHASNPFILGPERRKRLILKGPAGKDGDFSSIEHGRVGRCSL